MFAAIPVDRTVGWGDNMAEQWATETADALKRSRAGFRDDLQMLRVAGANEESWGLRQLHQMIRNIDDALSEAAQLYGIDPN